ncbi:hypothetical protein ES708_02609 [subsurface metagenome]
MGQDLPDYTRMITIQHTGGFIGLEELATRLGFIGPGDLHGNVLFMEDFETEITDWGLHSSAGSPDPVRTSRHKYSGNWSLKFAPVAGASEHAWADTYLYYPGATRITFFSRTAWKDDAQIMEWFMYVGDGAEHLWGSIRYNFAASTLEGKRTPVVGDYFTIDPALHVGLDELIWYPIALTFDPVARTYFEFRIAEHVYDLTAHNLCVSAPRPDPELNVGYRALPTDTDTFTSYLDDVVIVKNVPV